MSVRIELLRAWPRRHESTWLELPDGATIADALELAGIEPEPSGTCAIHGERAGLAHKLHWGDRLEILRPLQVDPKEARRRRAGR